MIYEGLCEAIYITDGVPPNLLPNLLPPPLIVLSLLISYYIVTKLSRLSMEVIAKQQRLSILFMLLLLPHFFPSNLKITEIRKRTGTGAGAILKVKEQC